MENSQKQFLKSKKIKEKQDRIADVIS